MDSERDSAVLKEYHMSTAKLRAETIIHSSDLEITPNQNAVFECDGECVFVEFYYQRDTNKRHPKRFVLSRDEACREGEQIAQSGFPGRFPFDAAPDDVKAFGRRMKVYGETGR